MLDRDIFKWERLWVPMRSLIKKTVPRSVLFFLVDLVYPFFYRYYLSIFKTLIVRKDTTDKHIFRQIFITNDCRIPVKANPKLIIDGGGLMLATLHFGL